MPITSGAKKALRASLRKRVFNDKRKKTMRSLIKEIRKVSVAKHKAEAEKLLPAVYKAIDKAAKRGVIKKNAAARKKSRLTKLVHKLT